MEVSDTHEKSNRKTAGKWRKSMPTTQKANLVFTNWG